MIYVVNLVKNIALALLSALDLAMFARAILSWIDPMGDGPLSSFLYTVTEPIILPFRKLFEKKNWFTGVPIDMAFFFAMISIMILQTLFEVLL
jgi:YggT family protein